MNRFRNRFGKGASLVKSALSTAALLGVLATAHAASAAPNVSNVTGPTKPIGIALDAKVLAPKVSTDLRAQIVKARTVDTSSFQSVRDLVGRARTLDAKARGGKAPIALSLAKMGPKALLPMLDLLAFESPSDLSTEDAAFVTRDLVEAVGLLRDARAMPVLGALLDRDADTATTRTVAEAIARLDSDEAASRLVTALSSASGERANAIVAGMGACHKRVTARAVADRLASHPDAVSAKVAAKALGHAGNAWAWKTLADRSEEAATREVAAEALVRAYVTYTDEAREAAAKALLVVDDVHTAAFIQNARTGASPETASALDALASRFAKNPAR